MIASSHHLIRDCAALGVKLPKQIVSAAEHALKIRQSGGPSSTAVAAEVAERLLAEHLGQPSKFDAALDDAAAEVAQATAGRELRAKLASQADAVAVKVAYAHRDAIVEAVGEAVSEDIAALNEHARLASPWNDARSPEDAAGRFAAGQAQQRLTAALGIALGVAGITPGNLELPPIELVRLYIVDVPEPLSRDDAKRLWEGIRGRLTYIRSDGGHVTQAPWSYCVSLVEGVSFKWTTFDGACARRGRLDAALNQPAGVVDRTLVRA